MCHFPHKWKHLDIEVCPEVRAVEALTHKVAGRQPVEEMSSADCWRRRSVTHTPEDLTHSHIARMKTHPPVNHTLVTAAAMSIAVSFFTCVSSCV